MPRTAAPLTLEHILLGIIYQHPRHGYDIYKEITRLDGIALIWRVKQSLLYALLDKLEAQALLSAQLIPGEAHPARKEYRLTDEGRFAFLTWAQSPVTRGRDMRQDFLARLFFARQLSPQAAGRLVVLQKAACHEWLDEIERQNKAIREEQQYERLVLRFRVRETEAMLAWLDECRQEVEIKESKEGS